SKANAAAPETGHQQGPGFAARRELSSRPAASRSTAADAAVSRRARRRAFGASSPPARPPPRLGRIDGTSETVDSAQRPRTEAPAPSLTHEQAHVFYPVATHEHGSAAPPRSIVGGAKSGSV